MYICLFSQRLEKHRTEKKAIAAKVNRQSTSHIVIILERKKREGGRKGIVYEMKGEKQKPLHKDEPAVDSDEGLLIIMNPSATDQSTET